MKSQQLLYRLRVIVAFILVVALELSVTRAGLRDAILTALDGIEIGNSHEFIAAEPGNDVGGIESSGPTLCYNPTTGNLRAKVPAALLTFPEIQFPGEQIVRGSPPMKLYSVADVNIGAYSFAEFPPIQASNFTWTMEGLGDISSGMEVSTADGRILWQPTYSADPSTDPTGTQPIPIPPAGKVTAAIIDFGTALPKGLTNLEVESIFSPDGLPTSFVDYANHRDVVTVTVPFSVIVVPEPTALVEAAIAFLFAAFCSCNRARHSSFRVSR